MDIDGKGIGMLAVLFIALIMIGFMLSNGWFYVIAGVTFIILIAGIFFGAGGSLRIRDLWS